MSSENINPAQIAAEVSTTIAKAANAALQESISTILAASAEQLERHREASRQIDAYLAERAEAHEAMLASAVRNLAETETRLSNSATQFGDSASVLMTALEGRINMYHDAAEAAKTAELAAVERLTEADEREAALVTRKEQAEAAEAAAEQRIADAVVKEERAEEAINVVRVRAELAVERAYAERDAKLKRKRLLAQLDQDEDQLINTFDLREEDIEKRFDVHYGHIKDELQRIVSDDKDTTEEAETEPE